MSRENVIEYVPRWEVQPKYMLRIPEGWPNIYRDDKIHKTSALYWWLCRIRFWRYRIHPTQGHLIEINRWTRVTDFMDDPDTDQGLEGAKDSLAFIASGGRRKNGATSLTPVLLLPIVWLPLLVLTWHQQFDSNASQNFLSISCTVLVMGNVLWFIVRLVQKMLDEL